MIALLFVACEEDNTTVTRITSGTSFGECLGYCGRELELTLGNSRYTAFGTDTLDYPDIAVSQSESATGWSSLEALVDFDQLLAFEDVIGCPDCADGGAEWIEVTSDGPSKKITFEYGDSLTGIQDLIVEMRERRAHFETVLFNE